MLNALLVLAGLAVASKVWAGQQWILAQPDSTLWFSDPYQQDSMGRPGSGMFSEGPLPPGEAPPWRLASEQEEIALERMEGTGQ